MRFEFDATNPDELSAVFVAIAVLRGGDMSLPLLGDDEVVVPFAEPPAPKVEFPLPSVPAVPAPPAAAVVPAPQVPAAPVAPAPPLASAGGVDLDADGLPWDKRIHSTPATKKKDGKWRQKRGLDAATCEAVTAELRQTMAAPPAAPVVPPPMFEESAPGVPLPPAADEPAPDAATVFGGDGAASASSAVPAPPVAAVPPAPPAASTGPTFADLMRKITTLQTAGHLTVEGTHEIARSLGIEGVRGLMARPDLIPSFDALLPVAP